MADGVIISKIDVKMLPATLIAERIFAPSQKLPTQVWGKTRTAAAIARRFAPVKTRRLRSSIVARKAPDAKRSEPIYEVYSDVRWAAPQEFGFVHWRSGKFVPGKHYMQRALRAITW